MIKSIHRGHVEFGEGQLGATLTLEPGGVLLEVASPAGVADPPERVELLRFTSNTGYFTLIHLFRRTHNMRLGVGGLSTYGGGLAFESGYFSTLDEIQSRSWSMTITDIAKVLHVNGVIQQFMLPQDGGFVMHWTIAPPQAVDLVCADANITVRLGQHIRTSGNAIDGPTVSLSYPADLLFPEEVSPETALRMMHRVRQFFSLPSESISAWATERARVGPASSRPMSPVRLPGLHSSAWRGPSPSWPRRAAKARSSAGSCSNPFALNPRFSFSLGYQHSYILPMRSNVDGVVQRASALQVGSLALGMSYRLTDKQSLNIAFDVGATKDAPDIGIVLRMPFSPKI